MSGRNSKANPLPIKATEEGAEEGMVYLPVPTQQSAHQLEIPFEIGILNIVEIELQLAAELLLSLALVDENHDLYIEAIKYTCWADDLKIKECCLVPLLEAGIIERANNTLRLCNLVALQAGI
jgi:hypothetical protein